MAREKWHLRSADGHSWRAVLRFHGESGMEAQIYRDGQLVLETKAEAVEWGMARCAVCGAVESELIRVSAIEAYHRAIDDNATLTRAMAEAERRVKRH